MTCLGRLGVGTGERFSYGLALAPPGGLQEGAFLSPNAAVWADFAADAVSFHAAPAALVSGRAVLETVKFAAIGPDGKYTEDPVIVDVADTPGGGGTFNATLPQAALVMSLGTARRGRSGRGRFYLPMPSVNFLDDLRLSVAQQDAAEAALAAHILNLGNQPGVDVLNLQVMVASTKGFLSPVTSVRVGRVVDTMRSRRRSLDEAYGAATVVNQGA
jgi:hypothetical protein